MTGRPLRPAPLRRRSTARPIPVWAAVALAGCAIAFLAVAVGAKLLIRPRAFDEATLCPATGPSAVTAVLIDTTDPLNPIQRAAVRLRLQSVVTSLRRDEEIAVYVLDPRGDPLRPVFRMCRPALPAEINELTGNRALARARFDKAFAPEVRAALESSTTAGPATRSPIMAAIQAITVSAFEAADARAGGAVLPKRLVIVSDMIENSEAGDHYGGVPDFSVYSATPAYQRVRSRLDGVRVTILYLRRDEGAALQGRAHIDFWNRWFADQGASVDDVVAIEG